MVYALLIVVGLALGSFVNALVWRIHKQAELTGKKKLSDQDRKQLKALSISQGRSMCLHCGTELRVRDLIPVISWLTLRGKCRYCGHAIPDTPVAELLVPALFTASYIWWPYSLQTPSAWLSFCCWLAILVGFVALTLYDFRWYLLPDRIVLPVTILASVYAALLVAQAGGGIQQIVNTILGVVVLAGLFYGLFSISDGRWIGGGDVKLAVSLGLLAGGPVEAMLVIFVASLTGLGFMLPDLAKGKATGGSKLPFGPFLIAGTVVVVLFGQSLIDWYLGLIV